MSFPRTISGLEFAFIDFPLLEQTGIDITGLTEIFRTTGDRELIKTGSKTQVTRLALGSQEIYCKRYAPAGPRSLLRKGSNRRRALRAFENSRRLADLGIRTAPVLAVIGRDLEDAAKGSGVITLSLRPAKTSTLLFLEDLADPGEQTGRRLVLEKVAAFLRRLHDLGVYPKDFKDTNVLINASGEPYDFFLVDCDAVLFLRSVSRRRRLKNLFQIGITLGAALSPVERLFFLRSYNGTQAKLKETDIAACLRRIASTIERHRHQKDRLAVIRSLGT